MKTFYKLIIILIICMGLILSLCLAQGEYADRTPSKECSAWVSKCLTDFQSIKPGMTRGEILKKFPMDGGVQGFSLIRFTHPECGYFKIDVGFDIKHNENDQNQMDSDDKATKVSKPYIEAPYMD